MKIFDKRPLCLILCIMLGSFVIFPFYGFFALFIPIILLLSSFIKPITRVLSQNFARLLALLSIFSILFSFIYFDLYFPAYKRFDGKSEIIGTVTDINDNSYNKRATIKTESINGAFFSSYKINAYLDNDQYYNYSIGSTIKIVGIIEEPPSTGSNETYYASRGISGIITEIDDFEILEVGNFPFSYKITAYRKSLSRNIISKTNPEVGGLLAALLLGEREYLAPQINLDFLRLGITHILALSGTHLVILSLGFGKLLMHFGINKKYSTIAAILFTIFYMAITGFSASVTRAGIMLIISSMLFLLSSSHDAMTSLFLSVAVICIITPYAIFDISLWLSAFATLGILVMTEYPTKYSQPSILKTILISFLATFFALSTTSFITFLKFDGVSLMSAIATLVFSIITELFIYAGILLLFFGVLAPIKYITVLIGDITIDLAALMSKPDFIYVSCNFTIVKVFAIIFTILLFLFFILDVKHKKSVTAMLGVILVFIFSLSAILTYSAKYDNKIIYDNTSTEQITLIENGAVAVVDISSYDEHNAIISYGVTVENKLARVDNYLLTHYNYGIKDYITKLLSTLDVDNLYLPLPQNENEDEIYEKILELSSDFRVKIIFYESNLPLNFKNAQIISIYNTPLDEGKKLMFSVKYHDKIYTYTTTSMLLGKTKGMATDILANSNTIIFGSHSKSEYELTEIFTLADTIIFSNNKMTMHSDIYDYYSTKCMYFDERKLMLTH